LLNNSSLIPCSSSPRPSSAEIESSFPVNWFRSTYIPIRWAAAALYRPARPIAAGAKAGVFSCWYRAHQVRFLLGLPSPAPCRARFSLLVDWQFNGASVNLFLFISVISMLRLFMYLHECVMENTLHFGSANDRK
jgi:hypothetical protein